MLPINLGHTNIVNRIFDLNISTSRPQLIELWRRWVRIESIAANQVTGVYHNLQFTR